MTKVNLNCTLPGGAMLFVEADSAASAVAEYEKAVAALDGDQPVDPPKPACEKRASKKAEEPEVAPPTTATEVAEPSKDAEAPAQEPDDRAGGDEPEAPPITRDDIRNRIVKLGREKGLAILAKYNAAKLSDLQESDYPSVMRAIEAAEQAA